MDNKSPLDNKAQWCEAHQGNVHEVYPVKRPGTLHWIFVCQRCLQTLKDVGLLEFIERGNEPYKHYHQLPKALVVKPVAPNKAVQHERYEINITKSEAAILRALGYVVNQIP